jgi:hypothetical protein
MLVKNENLFSKLLVECIIKLVLDYIVLACMNKNDNMNLIKCNY